MKILTISFVVLLFVSLSFGQTNYYVDNNLGSDNSSQGTGVGTSAWKTIEYAINHVNNPLTDSIVIHIANGEYDIQNNPIDVTRDFYKLTLSGENIDSTIIEANSDSASAASRVFQVHSGNKVIFKDLTVRFGYSTARGSGILNDSSYVVIQHCLITKNWGASYGVGGAVSNINGTMIVNYSIIKNNFGGDSCYGGGLGTMNGICEINNSSISNNIASGGGGIAIISSSGNAVCNITNCTISQNTATYFCGAIRIDRWLSPNDSVLVTINSSTIFNNTSYGASGIGGIGMLEGTQPGSQFVLKNSIVAGNNAIVNPDIRGTVVSGDYNLIQSKQGAIIQGDTAHNIYGVSPMCSSIALNNSLNGTETCAISSTSPARDVIPADSSNGAPLFDQRGAPRNGNYDIGAYEYWNDQNTFPVTEVAAGNKLNPKSFQLFQNYPNPFNPSTVITYNIPKSGFVKLTVYNAIGQKIADLVQEYQASGNHKIIFGASGLPSGIYFYRLQQNSYVMTKKMVLLK